MNTYGDNYSSEYDDDLQSLAEMLTELSIYSEHAPKNVSSDISGSDFKVGKTNFFDNSWIELLLSVQGWLGLDSTIDADGDPRATVELLFTQMPPNNTLSCCNVNDEGSIILTRDGLGRLSTRIEKAISLKNNFIESIENGVSLKQASEEWTEEWEEESLQTKRYVSNINAVVGTWQIYNFKSMAKEGQFDLNPSYQRDVVWSNKDSSTLIESVLRGIPLPSVIFSEVEGSYQIVDGKQRLTSILRFIGEHPVAIEYVKEIGGDVSLFQEDFKNFIKQFRIEAKDQNEKFLPFKLGRFDAADPLHSLSGKFYTDIKKEKVRIGGDTVTIKNLFESPSCEYTIPTITYKKTDVQDIHHVFSLYNKQGKKLNAEELRNAVFHNLKLTRLVLVLSGDRTEPRLFKDLVPFLNDTSLDRVQEVGSILDARGFGTARFKRTKVLSWVLSILLRSPNLNNNTYATPSTTEHINSLLLDIQNQQGSHNLNRDQILCVLAKDTQDAVLLHQEVMEAWPPSLRNKKSHEGKWEELPLVACLLGTIAVVAAEKTQILKDNIDDVRGVFSRIFIPEKTQNKTQWQFISFVALELLNALNLTEKSVGEKLCQKYGYNCLPVLQQISSGTSWYRTKR